MDRMQILVNLLGEEERANAEYITGVMERDTWTKTLQGIDDRMSVLGLRLANRPWEGRTHTTPF